MSVPAPLLHGGSQESLSLNTTVYVIIHENKCSLQAENETVCAGLYCICKTFTITFCELNSQHNFIEPNMMTLMSCFVHLKVQKSEQRTE